MIRKPSKPRGTAPRGANTVTQWWRDNWPYFYATEFRTDRRRKPVPPIAAQLREK